MTLPLPDSIPDILPYLEARVWAEQSIDFVTDRKPHNNAGTINSVN